jgi:hypothetical protein
MTHQVKTVRAEPVVQPLREQLAAVEVAFVDGPLLLDYAYAQGLSPRALVKTSSPGLLILGKSNIEALERNVPPARQKALNSATLPFSIALFEALANNPQWSDAAIVAARVTLNFQNDVYRTMMVSPEDLREAVAIVGVGDGAEGLGLRISFPWARLLAANPRLIELAPPLSALPTEAADALRNSMVQATWMMRFAFEDWQSIGYRVAQVVSDRLPWLRGRGAILMHSDNNLLKETALHLAFRGYVPRSLRCKPAKVLAPQIEQRIADMLLALRPVVADFVRQWVHPSFIEPLVGLFHDRTEASFRQYYSYVAGWRDAITKLGATRPRAAFANYPGRPDATALNTVCGEIGIPLVSAQHGVAREINQTVVAAQSGSENNSCDLTLMFNTRAAEVANNENRFPHGEAVTVGKPDVFWRSGVRRRRDEAVPPIFYASTALMAGNVQMIQSWISDLEKCRFELDIIDGVLGRIPHQVCYKPYPNSGRYLEPDILAAAASKHKNVSIYGRSWDLRYMLCDARVLIVARGSSSAGICIMSGKPVVYIDIPNQIPLRPEAREAFEAGVFVFDGGSPTLIDDMRRFLSQPLADIDAQWRAKERDRKAMIERFIASGGRGAGRRGAAAVMRLLNERRKASSGARAVS